MAREVPGLATSSQKTRARVPLEPGEQQPSALHPEVTGRLSHDLRGQRQRRLGHIVKTDDSDVGRDAEIRFSGRVRGTTVKSENPFHVIRQPQRSQPQWTAANKKPRVLLCQ